MLTDGESRFEQLDTLQRLGMRVQRSTDSEEDHTKDL